MAKVYNRPPRLNTYRYIIPKFNTSTYQKSYKIRARRIWNNLPSYITSMNLPFRQFKTLLFNYYTLALEKTYVVEDPRTWKSVCIKCNSARSFTSLPIDYYFVIVYYIIKLKQASAQLDRLCLNGLWTDCVMDKTLRNFVIVKVIITALKEHLKLSKIAKFSCVML